MNGLFSRQRQFTPEKEAGKEGWLSAEPVWMVGKKNI